MLLKGRPLYWNWNNTFYHNGDTKPTKFLEAVPFRKLVNEARNSISKLDKTHKVEEGDKVYFHSSSTVPRYKFSNYTQDKKISRVIKLENATKIIVNTDNLLQKIRNTYSYPTDYVLLPHDFFANLPIKPPFTIGEDEVYTLRVHNYTSIKYKYNTLPDISKLKTISLFDTGGGHTAENFIRELEEIKKDGRYVDDKVLNEQMGESFAIIDDTNYNEYNDMLKAKDPGTILTGLELIANTNYKDSTFYISLLLNGNVGVINAIPSKSVNVKNFLEYFKDIKWAEGVPNFLSSLRKKLKKENKLDEIKDKYIHQNMLDYANACIKHAGVRVNEVEFVN